MKKSISKGRPSYQFSFWPLMRYILRNLCYYKSSSKRKPYSALPTRLVYTKTRNVLENDKILYLILLLYFILPSVLYYPILLLSLIVKKSAIPIVIFWNLFFSFPYSHIDSLLNYKYYFVLLFFCCQFISSTVYLAILNITIYLRTLITQNLCMGVQHTFSAHFELNKNA